ncbi:MAG: NosD domain-containing protein [Acidobacteriota bacterium]
MKRALAAAVITLACNAAHAVTIAVTSNADNTTVDGQCTLREAIIAANTNATTGDCTAGAAGLDAIAFNIGTGAQTINLLTALPAIADSVTIDGTTQPGFSGAPLIELSGAAIIGAAAGITLPAGVDGNTIQGLVINRFALSGIEIQSASNLIVRNYIGTNAAGSAAAPNGEGIRVSGASAVSNTIGGRSGIEGNVISGNLMNGITIAGAPSNFVRGNTVGLNAARTHFLGNGGHGIDVISASDNALGGTVTQATNDIQGNALWGIHLQASNNNVIQDNFIGRNARGGILLDSSNDNLIGSTAATRQGRNILNGNGAADLIGAGVRILSGTGNRISQNWMLLNQGSAGGIGIDLGNDGATPNDSCDADAGANNLQNTPVITAATKSTFITITGTFNSSASTTFAIEFFASAAGNLGQGHHYLGRRDVSTTSGCNTSFVARFSQFEFPVFAPHSVTATAINPANETSEQAQFAVLYSPLFATEEFSPSTITAGEVSTLTLTIGNPGSSVPPTMASNLAVSDTYPSGLVNAPGQPSTTCGGIVTAPPGSSSFSLSGGSLAPGATCQVTVPVTASTPRLYVNVIPAAAITATNTMNEHDIVGELRVLALSRPTTTKTFAQPVIAVNQATRMAITLTNPNSETITGVAFSDMLPAGLAVAASPNLTNTCGGTLTAPAGAASVALSGGTIPANGSCTVSFDVMATTTGTLTNTITAGAVTSANAPPNNEPASASVQVVTVIPAITPLGLVTLFALIAAVALLRLRA